MTSAESSQRRGVVLWLTIELSRTLQLMVLIRRAALEPQMRLRKTEPCVNPAKIRAGSSMVAEVDSSVGLNVPRPPLSGQRLGTSPDSTFRSWITVRKILVTCQGRIARRFSPVAFSDSRRSRVTHFSSPEVRSTQS